MTDLQITTKPGDTYRSLRWPALYERLRGKGYSKQAAARISNAQARKHPRHKAATLDTLEHVATKGYAQAIVDAVADLVPELPRLKGEQIAPGITRIRGNLCNVHGKYGKCPGVEVAPAKGKKPKGGGKGRAAAKPKKTPEQRQAEREAKRQQNVDQTLTAIGMADEPASTLLSLAAGEGGGGDDFGLIEQGLVERDTDGNLRLSGTGRAFVNASERGDLGAARDALSRGRDSVAHGHAREQVRDERKRAAEQRKQEVAQRRAEAQAKREQAAKLREQRLAKQGKRGASGGGKQSAPVDRATERTQTAQATAQRVGLADTALIGLRTAAEAGGVQNADLQQQGLVGADGMTTDQGRRALTALERGDVRGYQAALQDARAQQARQARPTAARQPSAETEAAHRRGQARRENVANGVQSRNRRKAADAPDLFSRETWRTPTIHPPTGTDIYQSATWMGWRVAVMPGTLKVFKDIQGQWRWVSYSSSAYRDRDREIVSTKALNDDCDRADIDGQYGPLRWWHMPGIDLGVCDFNAMEGRILIESGTFKSERIARKVADQAGNLEISLGFLHPPTEPDADSVFHNIRRFERSLVPKGKASNLFTGFRVKEPGMATLQERWQDAKKQFGFTDDELAEIRGGAIQQQKTADAQQTAYKAQDPGAPQVYTAPDGTQGIIHDGRFVALKAAAPAIEEEPEVEVKDDGEGDIEVMAEEEPEAEFDDNERTISGGDVAAIAEAVATAIRQELGPLVGVHMEELKTMLGGYQTQTAKKDSELADLKQTVKSQGEALAELTGDQPAAGYRPSAARDNVLTDATLLAAVKGQNGNAGQFDDIIQGLGLKIS